MTRELTPLQAFRLFCKELNIEDKEFSIAIETVLKEKEKQDQILRIIKDYPFIINVILRDLTYNELEREMPYIQLPDQEEYDLLKEYFTNEKKN